MCNSYFDTNRANSSLSQKKSISGKEGICPPFKEQRRLKGIVIPRWDEQLVLSCFKGFSSVPNWSKIFFEDIEVSHLKIKTIDEEFYWYDIEDWFEQEWGNSNNVLMKLKALVSFDGQVKNFLVAASALQYAKKGDFVAILGSRAGALSVNWIVQLMAWLDSRVSGVTVVCYDPHEVTRIYQSSKNTIFFYARNYEGDGHEFDIVVDDIFAVTGPSYKQWQSKYWIMKDQRASATPFVHEREGRTYNFPLVPKSSIICPCRRCVIESSIPGITPYSDMVAPSYCRLYLPEHLALSQSIAEWVNGISSPQDSRFDSLIGEILARIVPKEVRQEIKKERYLWKLLPNIRPHVEGIMLSELPISNALTMNSQMHTNSTFLISEKVEEADRYLYIMTKTELKQTLLEAHGDWKLYQVITEFQQPFVGDVSKIEMKYGNLFSVFFEVNSSTDAFPMLKMRRFNNRYASHENDPSLTAYMKRIDLMIVRDYDSLYYYAEGSLESHELQLLLALPYDKSFTVMKGGHFKGLKILHSIYELGQNSPSLVSLLDKKVLFLKKNKIYKNGVEELKILEQGNTDTLQPFLFRVFVRKKE
jgi:hypothetical protein